MLDRGLTDYGSVYFSMADSTLVDIFATLQKPITLFVTLLCYRKWFNSLLLVVTFIAISTCPANKSENYEIYIHLRIWSTVSSFVLFIHYSINIPSILINGEQFLPNNPQTIANAKNIIVSSMPVAIWLELFTTNGLNTVFLFAMLQVDISNYNYPNQYVATINSLFITAHAIHSLISILLIVKLQYSERELHQIVRNRQLDPIKNWIGNYHRILIYLVLFNCAYKLFARVLIIITTVVALYSEHYLLAITSIVSGLTGWLLKVRLW